MAGSRQTVGFRKTLGEIADLVGGEVIGDRNVIITGACGIKEAKKGDLSFISHPRYLPLLQTTAASAVIVSSDVRFDKKPLLVAQNPSSAFTKIVQWVQPVAQNKPTGIHKTAIVAPGVTLAEDVSVGPYAVIEEGVSVGRGTVIGTHVFISSGCVIGKDSWIHSNAVIREKTQIGDQVIIHSGAVIGSDGFGYETIDQKHIKIPQTGIVVIEDDVEIGSNTTIDRARFGKTVIGRGTKIDNLVQIGHNVVVGKNCILVSQVGIAGSTTLEDNVVVAGQAGVVGHITIGKNAVIGARAGVSKDVPSGAVMLGEPARPIKEQKEIFAVIAKLPEMYKKMLKLSRLLVSHQTKEK